MQGMHRPTDASFGEVSHFRDREAFFILDRMKVCGSSSFLAKIYHGQRVGNVSSCSDKTSISTFSKQHMCFKCFFVFFKRRLRSAPSRCLSFCTSEFLLIIS